MPYYRLYSLNAHSGHIDKAEEFHASDDVEAIMIVQGREREASMELWQESRKVRRFDASPNMFQRYGTLRPA